jgi:hypothetical protein
MANFVAPVKFNNVELNVRQMTPTREQKTRKSVIGSTLVETPIIGIGGKQWEIRLSGYIVGTSYSDLGDKRKDIEDLYNSVAYSYQDGIHDGTFVIKSLSFEDNGDNAGMIYDYNMDLVEW